MPNATEILKEYLKVQAESRLLAIDFISLNDYLALLKLISLKLNKFKRKALFYLAAAVSDFYIPGHQLVRRIKLFNLCLF